MAAPRFRATDFARGGPSRPRRGVARGLSRASRPSAGRSLPASRYRDEAPRPAPCARGQSSARAARTPLASRFWEMPSARRVQEGMSVGLLRTLFSAVSIREPIASVHPRCAPRRPVRGTRSGIAQRSRCARSSSSRPASAAMRSVAIVPPCPIPDEPATPHNPRVTARKCCTARFVHGVGAMSRLR